ncbi:hypothetical protein OROGR_016369 [Orobanche gracilis]
MTVVVKRRRRTVLILTRVILFAIWTVALMALLSVHVQDMPADASHKLPSQHEIGYRKLIRERSWMQEFDPPHSKNPPTAHKV